jgi:hypothetical protein
VSDTVVVSCIAGKGTLMKIDGEQLLQLANTW